MARLFHGHYERLAPSFSYVTRKDSRVSFDDLPPNNRALMLAVCKEIVEWIEDCERAVPLSRLSDGEGDVTELLRDADECPEWSSLDAVKNGVRKLAIELRRARDEIVRQADHIVSMTEDRDAFQQMYMDTKAKLAEAERDARRIDWLESHKSAHMGPLNTHVTRKAASVEMTWLPEHSVIQRVNAETVRAAIDAALAADPSRSNDAARD